MWDKLKKCPLIFLIALMSVAHLHAANTKFTNLEVTGTATFDGAVTESGAVTSTGNNTATGTLTRTNTTTLSTTTFTGGYTPWQRTLAQLNALTASTTGQIIACSDCTTAAICISSGSVSAGSWVVAVATGSFVGSGWSGLPHCK